MEIVYISNSIIPSRTANSIHVMKMCNSFSSQGHDVVLLAPKREGECEKDVPDIFQFYNVPESFKVIKLAYPAIPGRSLIYAISIFRELNKLKPDLVYGRFLRGCYAATLNNYPLVLELHAPIGPAMIENIIFKKILNYSGLKKIVVISEALKNHFITDFFLENKQIIVAHDGADLPGEFIDELPVQNDRFKVGYIGHLYKGKGMEVLQSIAPSLPDIDFHIIGGTVSDISFWKAQLNLPNVFFHGFIPPSQLSSYINMVDVCILPNQKIVNTYSVSVKKTANIADYTSPLKMFEYMAHKKPIIASDIPVLREVLNDQNAVLVSPTDHLQWIKAIKELQNNPKHREQIAARGYNDFLSNYSWKERAVNILKNTGFEQNGK